MPSAKSGKARASSVNAAKMKAAQDQIAQQLRGAFGDYVRAQMSAQPQAAPQSAVAPMAPPPMMAPPMPPPPVAPPPMPVAPPMGQPPMMANLPPQLLAFIQSQAQRQPMPAMPVIDPRIRY